MKTLVCCFVLVSLLLGGCDETTDSLATDPSAAVLPPAAGSVAPTLEGIVLPPEVTPVTNPLELAAPLDQPVATEGQRVFAVPQRMLQGAKVGTAMKLAAAIALGREGENLIVQLEDGAPYPIHPAYVVVPVVGRLRNGNYVIASYKDTLHHAVVKNLVGNRVNVRFTDLGFKTSDMKLDPERVGLLKAGLAPGGYAAHLAEHEYRHVLLVSASMVAGKRRWLVLNHTGDTELVPDEKLRALPTARFNPRVGETVLAAWRGTMVRTQVKAVDAPSLLTVTRTRAGHALIVGPGMVMPTE